MQENSAQKPRIANQVRQFIAPHHFAILIFIVCLALLLSLYLFLSARNKAVNENKADFTTSAATQVTAIQDAMQRTTHKIDALSSFYAASVYVDRKEFREFVQYLLSHGSSLLTLEWLPRVTHSARSDFEKKTRLEGFPDFSIKEQTVQGDLVPAHRRAEYFPIYYLEPFKGHEYKLGFDAMSIPAAAQALASARDTGSKTITSRLAIDPKNPDQFIFFFVNAIYQNNVPLDSIEQRRRHLAGFVLAVFRIDDLVQHAFADRAPSGIDIYLFDDSAPAGERFISFYSPLSSARRPSSLQDEARLKQGVHFFESIDVAGKKWLAICIPSPGSKILVRSWRPWSYLGLGILLTGFLASYLGLLFSRMSASRQYASELLSAKEQLEQENQRRKNSEEALQQRENQLLESQRIARIGSWERDVATNRVTGSYELYRLWDIHPHTTELNLQMILDCIHPDDRDRFIKAGKEAVYENKPYSIEFRVISRGGTETVIHSRGEVSRDKEGKPIFFRGTVQDFTERHQAEEKASSLARILETSQNEIYIFDAETMKFIFVNQGARDNLGYSMEELRLMTPLHIKPEYTAQTFNALIEPIRANTQSRLQFTTVHRRKDNSVYPVEVHLQRSFFEHIPAYVAIILDITERKKLESQLLQANKMDGVGQLASGIAHDFNNILTAIIGYASIMQMKMHKDDPLVINLEGILASAQRAATLTQNLLSFSRKQIIQMHPIDLNKIVNNVAALLLRIIGEDVELKTTLAREKLSVQADKGQLEQVLMNLSTNARDAMPEGGILSIETSLVSVDTEIVGMHGSVPVGNYVLLSVSDTGQGMEKTTLKNMFDPFFTTKEVDKGTGLGLSIVYGIVKQHEGYISVETGPGRGTTIKIYLPLCQTATVEIASEELPVSLGGTETILYAEDDTTIREMLNNILTSAGYTVIAAQDGEDAIHKFIDNKDSVDLLVLDVIMPKKSGKEAYDAIRKIRSDIKALFLSGYSSDMIQKMWVAEDNLNFIYKPVSPKALLQKVRDVLR